MGKIQATLFILEGICAIFLMYGFGAFLSSSYVFTISLFKVLYIIPFYNNLILNNSEVHFNIFLL